MKERKIAPKCREKVKLKNGGKIEAFKTL